MNKFVELLQAYFQKEFENTKKTLEGFNPFGKEEQWYDASGDWIVPVEIDKISTVEETDRYKVLSVTFLSQDMESCLSSKEPTPCVGYQKITDATGLGSKDVEIRLIDNRKVPVAIDRKAWQVTSIEVNFATVFLTRLRGYYTYCLASALPGPPFTTSKDVENLEPGSYLVADDIFEDDKRIFWFKDKKILIDDRNIVIE